MYMLYVNVKKSFNMKTNVSVLKTGKSANYYFIDLMACTDTIYTAYSS